jgi:4-amino-4-deoxy-L-arabinose transferase-like glycosyltransferase
MRAALEERPLGSDRAPLPHRAVRARPMSWLAGALALGALLLPPRALAALLVEPGAPQLDAVIAGVWVLKAVLLAHAALLLLGPRFVPSGGPARPLVAARPAPGATTPDLWLMLAALLGFSLVIRLIALDMGLWYDEIVTLVRYARSPVATIVAVYDSQNVHPLYTLLAHGSIALIGDGAAAVRLPAALLGVASIGATWWFGSQLVSRREALLAALLLAVSYHHVWFSQNARGYTGLLLCALAGTGLLVRLLRGDGRWGTALGYAAAMALATWIHLTASFIVIAHALVVTGLWWRRPADRTGASARLALAAIVLAGTFSLLLHALILPQLVHVLFFTPPTMGATEWRNPVWLLLETVQGLARGLPGGPLALAAGGLVAAAGLFGYWRRSPAVVLLMLAPAVVTAGTMLVLEHNLWPRFFFFAAGFALLIVARGVHALAEVVWPRRAPVLATALLLLAAFGSAATVPRAWSPKQEFDRAMEFVLAARQPEDAVVVVGLTTVPYTEYFRTGWTVVETGDELARAEAGAGRTWLLYTFRTHLATRHPEVWRRVGTEYERITEFPGTVGGGSVHVMLGP